ncbi:BON domain-containing protein [Verticiella sediminum]|uniref:Osmotically-inducible protein Y n=1 Tax=Verticiella sediminum TaxID=1247510 RepID=A0A556AC85_9BURK|nr:BON domain-containing protein [Verticiella sediminum]TSH90488.1 BON domain-containing protein [Verticiella sediminum]
MLNKILKWFALFGVTFVLAACAATDTSRSAGEYTDDTAITARVKLAFVNDEQVSALDINVETFRGIVQLSGFVPQREMAQRAEQIARGVEGVKDVRNDIRLRAAQ